ncbi:hypothetical protein [Clostridium saccharobutylicum]|uniref:hypothetical protein n=1 Tax=Clostridium saccharobutylicum TaxID=169679 RepID=UPI00156DF382|nr:hypothetical protein [Clostridium saccharobutylicum]NSB89502.1 hypothetical protein [Clostridium saccharobutylicum]NYC27692.1 hypothetical protein [Clostridium saccharobutylicum]
MKLSQLINETTTNCISKKSKDEGSVDDVLVIWFAKDDCVDFTSVVEWYKHATVF